MFRSRIECTFLRLRHFVHHPIIYPIARIACPSKGSHKYRVGKLAPGTPSTTLVTMEDSGAASQPQTAPIVTDPGSVSLRWDGVEWHVPSPLRSPNRNATHFLCNVLSRSKRFAHRVPGVTENLQYFEEIYKSTWRPNRGSRIRLYSNWERGRQIQRNRSSQRWISCSHSRRAQVEKNRKGRKTREKVNVCPAFISHSAAPAHSYAPF